jgi:hypothetical protein
MQYQLFYRGWPADTSLGTIIVASPQKKNAPWKGKTSIDQVGTPEQVRLTHGNPHGPGVSKAE